MATKEEAIEKVVRILRLARGAGTEHEAHAALLAAQRMMYAHGIGEHEVEERSMPREEGILDAVVEQSGHRMPWNEYLAAVIAENFRCAYIISTARAGGVVRLVFIGRTGDVTVAGEAYRSAAAAGENLAAQYASSRAPEERAAATNSFKIGFLKGLYERFQVNTSERALMVLTEPAVLAHAAALTNAGEAQAPALESSDGEAARHGYDTGYQFGSTTKPLGQ